MATAQYSDACEAYNRAVNLNPNDPQVWCSLGVLYYAFGQYREALGMLSRALKLDPTMADAWYNVGALYDMCDQPYDAQQAYSKVTLTIIKAIIILIPAFF
jgi:glucose repression mediator protein